MEIEVKPILGTMNFGPQASLEESIQIIDFFTKNKFYEIDTAHVYNEGDSERFIGKAIKKVNSNNHILATKVNPRITGKLDLDSITLQLMKSLERLDVRSVDVLYLHFPDPSTPIHETLKACASLHEQGYFKELGLSNYSAWEVVNIWHICKSNGWLQPTIYQGLYNFFSRDVEIELIPALREIGMRFYAYNPLAGGILSGKYNDMKSLPIGRFTHRPNYKDRYWKAEFFNAIKKINKVCSDNDIKLIEAAFRWLINHSMLDGNKDDGVIIGCSNVEQLSQNLSFFSSESLPDDLTKCISDVWNDLQSVSPRYFRTHK